MKGVLAIANAKAKFVYQAVHMIFNGNFDEDEERASKLVFIGKNLNHKEIKEGFAACLDTPENQSKKAKALRFAVGAAVKCNTGEGWQTGKVVALMYRDDMMPPGMVAPYQVQLDNGTLIFAPADTDELILKA